MIRNLLIVCAVFAAGWSAQAQELLLSAEGASAYPCQLAYELQHEDGKVIQQGFVELASAKDQAVVAVKLPRRFAVLVYEDRNRNEKLDRGFLTQPLELYGFSNDAWSPLSKPSVDDMLVPSSGETTSVHLVLRSVGTFK
ncbi:MAG: Uncharacterised protein [Cryomorphaceae bacterium]|nr:MAG: Uncharacterised protein [Cryomorphaceae bacterium]